jgi:hypothetical protein
MGAAGGKGRMRGKEERKVSRAAKGKIGRREREREREREQTREQSERAGGRSKLSNMS